MDCYKIFIVIVNAFIIKFINLFVTIIFLIIALPLFAFQRVLFLYGPESFVLVGHYTLLFNILQSLSSKIQGQIYPLLRCYYYFAIKITILSALSTQR